MNQIWNQHIISLVTYNFYKVGYDKRTIEKADLTIFLFTFNTDQKIFQVIFYVQ